MTALQLLLEIESRLKFKIPETILVGNPTISALSSAIAHQQSQLEKGHVITVREAEGSSPIFVAHDHRGELWSAFNLSPFLKTDLPIYGVRPERGQSIFTSFRALARQNVKSLIKEHPQEEYRLIGYSFGGVMAFEMARQLVSLGRQVSFLGIVDIEPAAGKTMRKHRYPDVRERMARLKQRIRKEGLSSTLTWATRWLGDWYRDQRSNQSFGQIFTGLLTKSWRRLTYFFTKTSPEPAVDESARKSEKQVVNDSRSTDTFQHKMVNAFYEHSPGNYSGDITYFVTPSGANFVGSEPVSAWSKLTSGRVEIIQVHGDHLSIGKSPDIKQIAERLNQLAS